MCRACVAARRRVPQGTSSRLVVSLRLGACACGSSPCGCMRGPAFKGSSGYVRVRASRTVCKLVPPRGPRVHPARGLEPDPMRSAQRVHPSGRARCVCATVAMRPNLVDAWAAVPPTPMARSWLHSCTSAPRTRGRCCQSGNTKKGKHVAGLPTKLLHDQGAASRCRRKVPPCVGQMHFRVVR